MCVQGVCVSMVLACVCAFVTVCMAVTSSMAMFENVYFTQCMHTRTHARMHARTHAHTHTHTHTLSLSLTHSHLSQWLQSLVRKRRFVKKCGLINRQVSAATGHEYSSLCAATFNHGLTGPLHPSYINPNSKRRPHHQHNNHKRGTFIISNMKKEILITVLAILVISGRLCLFLYSSSFL